MLTFLKMPVVPKVITEMPVTSNPETEALTGLYGNRNYIGDREAQ
jgi:hypothetical protein